MRPPNFYNSLCWHVSLMLFTLGSLMALVPSAAAGPNDKVQICHIPPSNPANFHTITVNQNAVADHLAHGDKTGACGMHCEILCNDGNACTIDRCLPGTETCQPPAQRQAVDCNDSELCTTDSCNPTTGCVYTPRTGASCSDGNACTTADACDAQGNCAGTAITCTASDQCHVAGVCNPQTGQCSNPAKPNGASCSDGNACTTDACDAQGNCVGTAVTCTASDQCHNAGTCNPSTGLCSNPAKADNTPCTDSNACTQTDTCQSGVCTGSNPVECTASDQCKQSTCHPITGQCVESGNQPNGTACDDGNVCTVTSTCFNGTCSQFTAQRCDSGWGLGDASACAPATGCHTQCPAYFPQLNGQPDLCQPLDPVQTAAQGSCIYKPVFCQADGCYFTQCNPNTGQCERPENERTFVCDIDPCTVPPGSCDVPHSICTISTCDLSKKDVPNCGTRISASCSVPGICSGGGNAGQLCDVVRCTSPLSTFPCPCDVGGGTCVPLNYCQTNRVGGDTNSFGCDAVNDNSCQYTGPHCAETKPLGEPGNCQEYFENPENPGCCELRPKVCRATDFGLPADTTGYTFSCEQATGKCVATPQ